jgi:hypothetical protein
MLRRLVALRHAIERIERLESELRDQQAAFAAARAELEALVDAAARTDRILAAVRQRYATAALASVLHVRPPAATMPDHVVVASDASPGSVPPSTLVVLSDPRDELVPSWIATAAARLSVDTDLDMVIGDRVDVVGGRSLVTWADVESPGDVALHAEGAVSGWVVRGGVWNQAVTEAAGHSAGALARRLFAELAGADRVAAEGAVAAVATHTTTVAPAS